MSLYSVMDPSPSAQVVSQAEARAYIDQLDLSYIVDAMCASHYPLPRWTRAEAEQCCQFYKNFLYLIKKHLPLSLVPTRQIDEFWHNHILYTKQYTLDCMQIFGHYLHHEPASPDDNPDELVKGFMLTKSLYQQAFDEPLALI